MKHLRIHKENLITASKVILTYIKKVHKENDLSQNRESCKPLKLPNEILGGDARSFDCSTNQTTSSYVNSPIHNKVINFNQIWIPFKKK